MRVYVGERDDDGRPQVWLTHEAQRVDLAELVELMAQLRALADPVLGEGLDRAEVLARKEVLIGQIEAMEALPPPRRLVHRGTHSSDGFAWGSSGDGSADLAQSILCAETGMELAPAVYLAFRDDVIARLLGPHSFHLPAPEVQRWIVANRQLVERGLLEEPPRAAVVAGGTEAPAVVAADAAPDPDGASASRVVRACEAAWADIAHHHPGLPDAVMILGSGVERGRLVKLGHWWGGRWLADGQVRGEVLLAGEALHLPPEQVFEVLLHEAAHGLNAAASISDTSRGGRYHNQRFAASARAVLLKVTGAPPYGLAATSLTPEARERYGATIERLGEEIRIARRLQRQAAAGAEGTAGGEEPDGEGTGGKGRGAQVATCGCGRRMRMAPSVLARGPVLCGLCGAEFSAGAEPAAPGWPAAEASAGIVDRSFVGRRRLEVQSGHPSPDPAATVAHRLAVLDAALGTAERPGVPGLAPLRDRRDALAVLANQLGARPAAALDAEARQAEAVAFLAAGGPLGPRLTAWYQDFATLRATPMAAPDVGVAAELTRAARALLTADGTLAGPVVELRGRPFQAGDAVVARAEVPGGPPVGTIGAVVEADPDLGAVRVDFPTWGRVRASTGSALAAVLDHDYAEVRAPEPIVDRPAVERELERLGVGIEL